VYKYLDFGTIKAMKNPDAALAGCIGANNPAGRRIVLTNAF
jgi:hypothetical protein